MAGSFGASKNNGTVSGPKMTEDQVMAELKKLQHEMLSLNQSLQELSDSVSSDNSKKEDDVIVYGAVINISTPINFRLPKMYQAVSLFGHLKCLAISRHLIAAKDLKAIEAKLGRKLDKFDTIYVRRPAEGGPQGLILVRVVRRSDVVNKL